MLKLSHVILFLSVPASPLVHILHLLLLLPLFLLQLTWVLGGRVMNEKVVLCVSALGLAHLVHLVHLFPDVGVGAVATEVERPREV